MLEPTWSRAFEWLSAAAPNRKHAPRITTIVRFIPYLLIRTYSACWPCGSPFPIRLGRKVCFAAALHGPRFLIGPVRRGVRCGAKKKREVSDEPFSGACAARACGHCRLTYLSACEVC